MMDLWLVNSFHLDDRTQIDDEFTKKKLSKSHLLAHQL
jgi:hypothetical protein